MLIELKDTSSPEILNASLAAHRNIGVASGLVMTLVVICTPREYKRAFQDVSETGAEHPSRILMLVTGSGKQTRLDAEVRVGENMPGDLITLRLGGDLNQHADSVVLPLLLPDLPVVVWWPGVSPKLPEQDPVGRLGNRRITDAANTPDPIRALLVRAEHHAPGDTDLTWTRLTRWRALISSALDQCGLPIRSAVVEGPADNAPAGLMAAWLHNRLKVPVSREIGRGPGLHAVRLQSATGEVSLSRTSSVQAAYVVPQQPKRRVALPRRSVVELLSEELRRLDVDNVFDQTMTTLFKMQDSLVPPQDTVAKPAPADKKKTAAKSPAKTAAKAGDKASDSETKGGKSGAGSGAAS